MSETENTASAIRYEQCLVELRQRYFYQHPENEAESIAKHYTAHALIALQLLKMIDVRKNTGGYAELDRSIQALVDEIKINHLHDFGTPITLTPCDHEWETIDDSFSHEFGTEVIVYSRCKKCDAETQRGHPVESDN